MVCSTMNLHPSPLRRALTAALCFIILHSSCRISRAADSPPPPADLRALLRDALFEEEATRDLPKAAAGYEALLAKWNEQRLIAAAALYRLAEVRRKQDRKDDAIQLYQRLVTEFADQNPHARLSRENLAALGAKEPAPGPAAGSAAGSAVSDEEAAAFARVQKLAVESPDLLTGKEFTTACEKGWLSVVKFLRGKGVKDSQDGIQAAAKSGHLAVCAELLTQPYTPQALRPAIKWAVMNNRSAVLRLLLEKGADTEVPPGTVPLLTVSILLGNQDSTDLLLQHQSAVLPANATTTPQFAAAKRANANLLQRLLDLGADATAGGSAPNTTDLTIDQGNPRPGNSNNTDPLRESPGSTPLHAAVASGSAECVSLLLKAKADPNATNDAGWTPLHGAAKQGNAALIELLLAAGAAPDGPAAKQGNDRQTPLWLAIESGKIEAVAALLKGKANPNVIYSDYTPLAFAVGRGDEKFRDAATALLLAHGADPTLAPGNAIREAPTLALKLQLLRGYQYPKLAAEAGVTLIFADGTVSSLASRRTPDEQPASLPTLLLTWHDAGGWNPPPTATPDWSVLRLFRKGADGKMAGTLIPIKAGTDFPALQWGDVVEVVSASTSGLSPRSTAAPTPDYPNRRIVPPTPGGSHQDTGLPPETLAILRSTQTVRVTLKSGDFTRDLTLRGILRVYDPSTTEAPLISTGTLVPLIFGDQAGMVKIERTPARGGGIVEWSAGSGQSGTALPEEGDIITFTPDPKLDSRSVGLRIPGHPGRWANTGDDQNPTLFQFLADFYGPLPFFQVLDAVAKYSDTPTPRAAALKALTADDLLSNLIRSGGPVSTRPYLPWPDWSSVKIRRMVKSTSRKLELVDGKGDTTVYSLGEPETINLLAAMAAVPADALPEVARKLDIPLKPGDEVELAPLKDRPGGPWPGFDEATIRLFQKALVTNVTFSDDTGQFRRVTLQWLPPRWVPTPAGVLPIPDGDATDGRVHWLRARDLVNSAAPGYNVARLTRDGETHQERDPRVVSEYFLRPGDTLFLAKSPAPSNTRPATIIQPTISGARQ